MCISFVRCFRNEWRISVLPCSHKHAVAYINRFSTPLTARFFQRRALPVPGTNATTGHFRAPEQRAASGDRVNLFQGQVSCVTWIGLVCSRHSPAQDMCIYWLVPCPIVEFLETMSARINSGGSILNFSMSSPW